MIGLYLVSITSWLLLLFCAASLLVAYGYSAGPLPLGDVGLGQPLVFIFMGLLMVMATYYVQTVTLTRQALLAALPVACLVTAILVVNDLRDIDEDRQAGKVTPVSRFGPRFGVRMFVLLVAGAYMAVLGWIVASPGLLPLLLVLLALPKVMATTRLIRFGNSRATLNRALQGSAQLHLQFGTLLALGLVISSLSPVPRVLILPLLPSVCGVLYSASRVNASTSPGESSPFMKDEEYRCDDTEKSHQVIPL